MRALAFTLLTLIALPAAAQPAGFPKLEDWTPPVVQTGTAKLVREYNTPEARQGGG